MLTSDTLSQISKYFDRELYSKISSYIPSYVGYFKKEKVNIKDVNSLENLTNSFGGIKLLLKYSNIYETSIDTDSDKNTPCYFHFIGNIIYIANEKFICDDFLLKLILKSRSGYKIFIMNGTFNLNLNYSPIPKLNDTLNINSYTLKFNRLRNFFGEYLSLLNNNVINEEDEPKMNQLFELINNNNIIKNVSSARKNFFNFENFLVVEELILFYDNNHLDEDDNVHIVVGVSYTLTNNYGLNKIKYLTNENDNFLFENFSFQPKKLKDFFINFVFDKQNISHLFLRENNLTYYYYKYPLDNFSDMENFISLYKNGDINPNLKKPHFTIEKDKNIYMKYNSSGILKEISSTFEYENLRFFYTKNIDDRIENLSDETTEFLRKTFPYIEAEFFNGCSNIDILISYKRNNYSFNMRSFYYEVYPHIKINIDFYRNDFYIFSSISTYNDMSSMTSMNEYYDLQKFLYKIYLYIQK